MKKPFWNTNKNPITGYKIEAWSLNKLDREELVNLKNRRKIWSYRYE